MALLLDAAVPVLELPAPPTRCRIPSAPRRRRPAPPRRTRISPPWAALLASALLAHVAGFWKDESLGRFATVLSLGTGIAAVAWRRSHLVATRRAGLAAWAIVVAAACVQLAQLRHHVGAAGVLALVAFGTTVFASGASLERRNRETTVPFPVHAAIAVAVTYAFHAIFVSIAPPPSPLGWG